MKQYNTNQSSKSNLLSSFLLLGILACVFTIIGSLYAFYRPFTPEDLRQSASRLCTNIASCISSLHESFQLEDSSEQLTADASDTRILPDADTPASKDASIPYLESTGEQGDISSFSSDIEDSETLETIYTVMLDTGCGPMLYYHQGDLRWGNYLYGGEDPMNKYGCGPTAVSMIINSFSDTPVTPTTLADWSTENGGYALHSGSYHSLIPDALTAYGFDVESVTDRSYEHVSDLLSSGHILVALMGKGSLTKNGHFVLFTKLLDNGEVRIADPANYENCSKDWDLEQLLSELKKVYDNGAPLWSVAL